MSTREELANTPVPLRVFNSGECYQSARLPAFLTGLYLVYGLRESILVRKGLLNGLAVRLSSSFSWADSFLTLFSDDVGMIDWSDPDYVAAGKFIWFTRMLPCSLDFRRPLLRPR